MDIKETNNMRALKQTITSEQKELILKELEQDKQIIMRYYRALLENNSKKINYILSNSLQNILHYIDLLAFKIMNMNYYRQCMMP